MSKSHGGTSAAKGSKGQGRESNPEKSAQKSSINYILGGIALALVAFIGIYFFALSSDGNRSASVQVVNDVQAGTGAGASEVAYPATLFDDGKARFYSYKGPDGVTIRYFALKSSDGVVRAAFDACDVCFREGKGYVQQGDDMVCRNCGRRFPSVKVNVVTGGCNPAALNRETRGGMVVIQVKDILAGERYFAQGGRG